MMSIVNIFCVRYVALCIVFALVFPYFSIRS